MSKYFRKIQFPISLGYMPNLQAAPLLDVAMKEAELMLQAPNGMIVLTQLSAIAIALQGLINVEMPIGKKVPVSLFALTVAGSGERKSSTENLFTAGIKSVQKEHEFEYERQLKEYKISVDLYNHLKLKLKKLCSLDDVNVNQQIFNQMVDLSKQEPIKPKAPKVLYEDTTVEALLDGLKMAQPNAFLGSSEGGIILDGRTASATPYFNALWSGDDINVSRKTQESLNLSDRRLSIHIMVQPDTFQLFSGKENNNLRDNGFFSRTLVCSPLSTCGYRQINGFTHTNEGIKAFNNKLKMLLEASLAMKDFRQRHTIVFSPEAKNIWLDIYNDIEAHMAPGGMFEVAKDHASKLPENIARVAALIHCFEYSYEQEISPESLWLAVELVSFYSRDFMMLFCPPPKYVKDANVLLSWLLSFINADVRYIRKNYILQYGPVCVRKKKDLDNALHFLKQQNPLVEIFVNRTKVIDLRNNMPFEQAKLLRNLAQYV